MMAEITINETELRAAILAALEQMPRERRDELVAEAVGNLVRGDTYNLSALRDAYKWAAQRVATEALEEEFKRPEVVEQIRGLVAAAHQQLFEKDFRDKLVEKLANAMSRAMVGERY